MKKIVIILFTIFTSCEKEEVKPIDESYRCYECEFNTTYFMDYSNTYHKYMWTSNIIKVNDFCGTDKELENYINTNTHIGPVVPQNGDIQHVNCKLKYGSK